MINILFDPKAASRHPVEVLFIGVFYASISILLSSLIFPSYASLISVFFTSFACFYMIQGMMNQEEAKEWVGVSENELLREHMPFLILFLSLFLGIVISFFLFTYVLPVERVEDVFMMQKEVSEGIKAMSVTGNAVNMANFEVIFFNNIKVLVFSFFISLVYGAGAIFVITWNASIMGYVLGMIVKTHGIHLLPVALVKYFIHGIPEMFAYLTIILAGGIVYSALIKGDFKISERRKKIVFDTSILALISIGLIFVSALIEVLISPFI